MLYVWAKGWRSGAALVVGNSRLGSVEVRGSVRVELTAAALNCYEVKFYARGFPIMLVNVGQEEGELIEAIRALSKLKFRRDADLRELLKKPALAELKRFIAVRKVVGGESRENRYSPVG